MLREMLSPAWYKAAASAERSLGGTAFGRTELERIVLLGEQIWESFAYIRESGSFAFSSIHSGEGSFKIC
jgi:hypothetical protein